MIDPIVLLLLAMNIVLVAANVVLFAANHQLKNDLFQREKWHQRELQKWRERF